MSNHRQLWDKLISAICLEIIDIEKQPQKTLEDFWVEGTLQSVLRKMCALHKLPPSMQKAQELTRPLFGCVQKGGEPK